MARVKHVKRAQQRYETVPVLGDDGTPVKTPVMKTTKDRETGDITQVQKTTKTGRPVFMKVTVEDRSKPKPNYTCDACLQEIAVGTAYKYVVIKTSTYGSTKKTRHEGCPSWMPWDLSDSLSAQLARIAHDFTETIDSCESPDDVQSALDDAAASIEEIVEAKKEAASNIEEGFGHATSASEQLEEIADELETWASDVSSADIPELPEPEDRYFIQGPDGARHGDDDGYETEDDARIALTGMIDDLVEDSSVTEDDYEIIAETPDEPSEDELNTWRDAVRDEVTILDEAPV